MSETTHFINDGYGWACKRCRAAEGVRDADAPGDVLPRFFREGEAEEREPRLTSPALARWKDDSHRTLVCPRCDVEEEVTSGE